MRERTPLYRVKRRAWKDMQCAVCRALLPYDESYYAVAMHSSATMVEESHMCAYCSRAHVNRARRYWRRVREAESAL